MRAPEVVMTWWVWFLMGCPKTPTPVVAQPTATTATEAVPAPVLEPVPTPGAVKLRELATYLGAEPVEGPAADALRTRLLNGFDEAHASLDGDYASCTEQYPGDICDAVFSDGPLLDLMATASGPQGLDNPFAVLDRENAPMLRWDYLEAALAPPAFDPLGIVPREVVDSGEMKAEIQALNEAFRRKCHARRDVPLLAALLFEMGDFRMGFAEHPAVLDATTAETRNPLRYLDAETRVACGASAAP